jgi:two-component system, OmpR family, sensor histidine kinase TctE
MSQSPKPSLRRKILRHVLWPLTLTWALGAALALGLAHYFTTQAYDRALLDDAFALSAQVRSDSRVDALGKTTLNLILTDAEMGAVLFDQSESIYFSVWRADGTLLAGHKSLRPAVAAALDSAPIAAAAPTWRDGAYLGKDVRIVSLSRDLPAPHIVLVAQTTASRNDMLRRLLGFSLLPQLLLLALLAWWLRRQVEQDLKPLSALQKAVEQRDASDLRHIPSNLTHEATTSNIEHLGLAVNSLFDRLQLGIAAQREFSGNVAHELRTPLASIRLQAEQVLTQSADPATQGAIRKLLRSSDQASHLIDQLLALAFANELKAHVPLTRLDLTEVVREVVLHHLPRAEANERRGAVDFGAEGLDAPVYVMGHRTLIEAVLSNLIDNAFRYGLSKTEGVASKITVAVTVDASSPESGAVCLQVIDQGAGLTVDEVAHLTQRWTQAQHDADFAHTAIPEVGQGVGLGLAIVSRYAELLQAPLSLLPNPHGTGLCAQLKFKDELS